MQVSSNINLKKKTHFQSHSIWGLFQFQRFQSPKKKIEKMFIFSPQRRRLRPGGLDAPARRVSPGQRREPCSVTDGGRGAALRRGCGAAAESILTKGYGGALGVGEIHGDTLRSTMGNFNSSKKHNSMPGSMFMEDDSPKIGISPRNIGGSQYTWLNQFDLETWGAKVCENSMGPKTEDLCNFCGTTFLHEVNMGGSWYIPICLVCLYLRLLKLIEIVLICFEWQGGLLRFFSGS